jgi:hypothetical protein
MTAAIGELARVRRLKVPAIFKQINAKERQLAALAGPKAQKSEG